MKKLPPPPPRPPLNGEICILCQKETTESLVVPDLGTRSIGSGYRTLAENLKKAHDCGYNPLSLEVFRLDNGEGIEETLRSNHASWHKLYKNKYSDMKIDGWGKRKSCDKNNNDNSSFNLLKSRRLSIRSDHSKARCLICDGLGRPALGFNACR